MHLKKEGEQEKKGKEGSSSSFHAARVKTLHLLPKEALVQMGVNLSGAHRTVSQHFLHNPDVRSTFHQVSRKGVPECVRTDLLSDSRLVGGSSEHGEDHLTGQFSSSAAKKKGVFVIGFDIDEVSVLLYVACNGVQSEFSNWNDPLFVPFANDFHHALDFIDAADAQPHNFRDSEAAAVHGL